jgi:hypothetical protein
VESIWLQLTRSLGSSSHPYRPWKFRFSTGVLVCSETLPAVPGCSGIVCLDCEYILYRSAEFDYDGTSPLNVERLLPVWRHIEVPITLTSSAIAFRADLDRVDGVPPFTPL